MTIEAGVSNVAEPPDTCRQAMLDIETMSTHPSNSLVLSVGMAGFEIESAAPVFGKRFDIVLTTAEQFLLGREVNADTQRFWIEQQKLGNAAHHWLHGVPSELGAALNRIAKFLASYETVWANGIVFDIGNLETLYRSTQIAVPWKYNAIRDARTIYRAFPEVRKRPEGLNLGPAHDPVTDCVHQIWSLWEHWPDLCMLGRPASIYERMKDPTWAGGNDGKA